MRCFTWIRKDGRRFLMLITYLTFPCLFIKLLLHIFRPDTNGRKVILFWTKYFTGRFPHIREGFTRCPNQSCYLTDDRYYLSEAAAVIFHASDFQTYNLPKTRTDKQLYVFYSMESPVHTGNGISESQLRYFFNATWTYRFDSDVPDLSYLVDWKVEKCERNNSSCPFLRKKNNRAMVLLSHCKSHGNREAFISELGKHFPVDIFGGCGIVKCPMWSPDCERKLVGGYSFYLAFENSHCKDYVTEKILRGYNYGAVPVVYGGVNYSQLFLPRNSFIDVADFASPKELGAFLHNLALSPDKYERLHDWRFDRRFCHPTFTNTSWGVCRLCELLHDPSFYQTNRSSDLYQWWTVDGNCTSYQKR